MPVQEKEWKKRWSGGSRRSWLQREAAYAWLVGKLAAKHR
jgi:hypothetical protein